MLAVVGASDHCGWAELVAVGLEAGRPVLLDRRRAELIEPGLDSAPYHHQAPGLPLAEAQRLVDRVRRSVEERTRAALAGLAGAHGARALAVQQSGIEWPLPLADVLASRRITYAADGALYRETLAAEAAGLGWIVARHPRRVDPARAAAEALRVDAAQVTAAIAEMGRRAGRPWTKEHRDAAAAALCVLVARGGVRL